MKSIFNIGDNVRLKGQTKIMSVESLVDLDAKDLSGFKKVMANNQRALGMQTGDVCELFCEDLGERVVIGDNAVLYLRREIYIFYC